MQNEVSPMALVVDDEDLVRQVTRRVLKKEGFACDEAADGDEALKKISETKYDIVVTDLRMPNKHGHSLCLQLLALEDRPIVVVATGVIEPKLAKELTSRGVDDIVFKPIHLEAFAAKMRGLVDRRLGQRLDIATAASEDNSTVPKPGSDTSFARSNLPPNSSGELTDEQSSPARSLAKAEAVMPIPVANPPNPVAQVPIRKTPMEIFKMTSSGGHGAAQIATAIEVDPSFAAEVLRLANSKLYNSSGIQITRLDVGVSRVGQQRIGELALATHALRSLTETAEP